MEVKVLDLAANGSIEVMDEEELWDGGWDGYMESLEEASLDPLPFMTEGIEPAAAAICRHYFIIDDGGEALIGQDASIYWVCWRGGTCRVWRETDNDVINDLLKKVGFDWGKYFVW